MESLKFSVVTVVLNRRTWIRGAIESVLTQGYANFEHIVVDGGSTDGTLDIIREYPHVRWISESDGGSVFALNKGLALITGDVFCWLNSDETYLPGTFATVSKSLNDHPEWAMVYGTTRFVDDRGRVLGQSRLRRFRLWRQVLGLTHIPAPSAAFVRRSALDAIGGRVDEQWRDTYDSDLWIRIGKKFHIEAIPQCFSTFALHGDSGVSSVPHRALRELVAVRRHHGGERTLFHRKVMVPCFNIVLRAYWVLKWKRMLKKGGLDQGGQGPGAPV